MLKFNPSNKQIRNVDILFTNKKLSNVAIPRDEKIPPWGRRPSNILNKIIQSISSSLKTTVYKTKTAKTFIISLAQQKITK